MSRSVAPPPAAGAPSSEARAPGHEGPRDELDAAPPFLTWRAIYALVIAVLVAQVALYAALTAAYR